ncbi:MAG: ABC transporter ATP-binding protein [Bordetella sp.]|jgi:putative ABC transport system ATP-binding protein
MAEGAGTTPSMAPLAIEARGLAKWVSDGNDKLSILQDINLQVHAGESLAMVGPSGCGKSTLLGLLAGLDTPSHGEVYWAGEPISSLSEEQRSLRRNGRFGFVFQSFQLLPQLNALENVMLPLELRDDRDAKSKAIAMLSQVGLSGREQHFPATLSGGEQQRVALARAFVVTPELLFADEPTGSLDYESGARVMELFFDLQKSFGTTLIVVTHDESLAKACSRCLRMQAGRIV